MLPTEFNYKPMVHRVVYFNITLPVRYGGHIFGSQMRVATLSLEFRI